MFAGFKAESLKVSVYRRMTLTLFHTLNIIKQMGKFPDVTPEEEIDFKFKKQGVSKLLVFDLDETLIHSLRSDDDEEGDFPYLYNEAQRMDKSLLQWVDITDPATEEMQTGGFFVRPFAKECLESLKAKYEVAIFTIATDWYADPIIDLLDPDGSLIQHRFYRQHARQHFYNSKAF